MATDREPYERSAYDREAYDRGGYGRAPYESEQPQQEPYERGPYDREAYDRGPNNQDTYAYPQYRPPRDYQPNQNGTPPRSRRGSDDDESLSWRGRLRQKRKNMPLWQELPLLLIVAFCLAVLVRTFLVQAFFIPSGSMEQTLLVGDRVLVNKIVYDVREPERGEVVVFRGTDNWAPENQVDTNVGFFAKLGRTLGDLVGVSQPGEKDFIKRVIGLPGDTIACCDVSGKVTVNGYPLDEPYVTEDSPLEAPPNPRECRSRRFGPVTIEPGQMWVMGDHRLVSQDSRCQGQVPIDNVIGRAFVVVWPSSRWAGLGVPATFAKVPKATALGPPHPRADTVVVNPRDGSRPVVPDVVFTTPILASLVFPARSRRIRRPRPRTLPA